MAGHAFVKNLLAGGGIAVGPRRKDADNTNGQKRRDEFRGRFHKNFLP
jgi:hypothetical protein